MPNTAINASHTQLYELLWPLALGTGVAIDPVVSMVELGIWDGSVTVKGLVVVESSGFQVVVNVWIDSVTAVVESLSWLVSTAIWDVAVVSVAAAAGRVVEGIEAVCTVTRVVASHSVNAISAWHDRVPIVPLN